MENKPIIHNPQHEQGTLRVAFISTEVAPFAKTGGLADVASALPKALSQQGAHVDILMPLYGHINTQAFGLRKLASEVQMEVPLGYYIEGVGVWQGTFPDSNIRVYFISHAWFFERANLYGDLTTGQDYSDNAARFTYFSRACLEVIKAFDLKPDIIHCNDYQTALIPAYLNLVYQDDPVFEHTATLYTIHNIQYQGRYPRETIDLINVGYENFYPTSPFEYFDQVNFMKAGLVYADLLNTVSKTYAREIQTPGEFDHGMEGVLQARSKELFGIVNGIDYDIWNPATDPLIPFPYNHDDLSGKIENKTALLSAFGLDASPDTPVIGIVSRLASQKGFDILGPCLDPILKQDVRVVVLGTGEARYHDLFNWIAAVYPEKIGVKLTFDNQLAHLIEAGSDMFLMPSQYEPCGLNQLYSLRYGTLPIVRKTGGLADTVRAYNSKEDEGTGFVFHAYTSEALLSTVNRALETYRDHPAIWQAMRRRGMQEDFSWETSAAAYMDLYYKALRKKGVERY